jgi:hypothetical protein
MLPNIIRRVNTAAVDGGSPAPPRKNRPTVRASKPTHPEVVEVINALRRGDLRAISDDGQGVVRISFYWILPQRTRKLAARNRGMLKLKHRSA